MIQKAIKDLRKISNLESEQLITSDLNCLEVLS